MSFMPYITRLCFFHGKHGSGIGKIFKISLLLNNIFNWSQHSPTCTIDSVSRAPVSLPNHRLFTKIISGQIESLCSMALSYSSHTWVFCFSYCLSKARPTWGWSTVAWWYLCSSPITEHHFQIRKAFPPSHTPPSWVPWESVYPNPGQGQLVCWSFIQVLWMIAIIMKMVPKLPVEWHFRS